MNKANRLLAEGIGTVGFAAAGRLSREEVLPYVGSQLIGAITSLQIDTLWLYLTAPVVGTVLAAPTCRWIQGDECCSPGFSGTKANA